MANNWACKAIEKSSFKSRKIVERVRYEMRVMAQLPQHKNVVGFHHLFDDGERVYMMMEQCSTRTLHDLLLRRKRLTEFEARYFTAQLAEGISALHRARIIHRDIKHTNLLLDNMNRIKIADFGLSTIVSAGGDRKKSFLGTPNFLAPELVMRNGQGHSFGVDVWATGVLLFVMLYGYPPFSLGSGGDTKGDLHELYHRIVDRQIVFPFEPHTTPSVQALIRRLCCKTEDDRLAAADIGSESWFLTHADSSVPTFMPDSIFDTPIRTLQEYKCAVAAGSAKQRPPAEPATYLPTAAAPGPARTLRSGASKPVAVRRPLEPIPENVARAVPSATAAAAAKSVATRQAVAKLAAARPARVHAPARALARDAEKENRAVGDEKAGRGGPGEFAWRAQPDPVECEVRAEFGQVTKLSEAYIPSIVEWEARLDQFCTQARRLLQRPSS
ncbi:Cell cycle serine/threonine-protein kinase cdc5/MSD2, partial [Coemansia spiralis]